MRDGSNNFKLWNRQATHASSVEISHYYFNRGTLTGGYEGHINFARYFCQKAIKFLSQMFTHNRCMMT